MFFPSIMYMYYVGISYIFCAAVIDVLRLSKTVSICCTLKFEFQIFIAEPFRQGLFSSSNFVMGLKPWLHPAPTYRPIERFWDSDEEAPGPHCGHSLTIVAAT